MPDTISETRTWLKAMMLSVPLPALLACRRTVSAADMRAELARLDLPTLILQGDKDASAPLSLTGVKTAELIKGSKLVTKAPRTDLCSRIGSVSSATSRPSPRPDAAGLAEL
jgi:pimeloyl-ACP methyl ester carboxylesterase